MKFQIKFMKTCSVHFYFKLNVKPNLHIKIQAFTSGKQN